jgi:hypothetical protein
MVTICQVCVATMIQETWLLSHCLAMDGHSESDIPDFRWHATVVFTATTLRTSHLTKTTTLPDVKLREFGYYQTIITIILLLGITNHTLKVLGLSTQQQGR